MSDPVFVDTNLWVYMVDDAEPVKQRRAIELVSPDSGLDLAVSTQVLVEFYSVTTRKLRTPLSEPEAAAVVERMSSLRLVAVDGPMVAAAIDASQTWRISIWDALIVRAAEVAGCRRLLSEDLGDGTTYGSVTVENPFTRAA